MGNHSREECRLGDAGTLERSCNIFEKSHPQSFSQVVCGGVKKSQPDPNSNIFCSGQACFTFVSICKGLKFGFKQTKKSKVK